MPCCEGLLPLSHSPEVQLGGLACRARGRAGPGYSAQDTIRRGVRQTAFGESRHHGARKKDPALRCTGSDCENQTPRSVARKQQYLARMQPLAGLEMIHAHHVVRELVDVAAF